MTNESNPALLMGVKVDGQPQKRRIVSTNYPDSGLPQYVPETREGEQVIQTIGNSFPIIVKGIIDY